MRASNWQGLAFPKYAEVGTVQPSAIEIYDAFRADVWQRDRHRSRVTGQPLSKSDRDWRYRGEVCHLRTRGAHPELRTVVSNALLMSAEEHWLSDARGGRALRLYDPVTLAPATDANRPILFVLKDREGHILLRRISAPGE